MSCFLIPGKSSKFSVSVDKTMRLEGICRNMQTRQNCREAKEMSFGMLVRENSRRQRNLREPIGNLEAFGSWNSGGSQPWTFSPDLGSFFYPQSASWERLVEFLFLNTWKSLPVWTLSRSSLPEGLAQRGDWTEPAGVPTPWSANSQETWSIDLA